MGTSNKTFHLQDGISIFFNAESVKIVQGLLQQFQDNGLKCRATQSITDGSFMVEFSPRHTDEGIPISEGFVQRVLGTGGRFVGGPQAQFLNRVGRAAAQGSGGGSGFTP